MPKSKDSQVSLEEFGKSTFSCSDYLIFLDNPQLLRLIRYLVEVGEILFHKKSLTFL